MEQQELTRRQLVVLHAVLFTVSGILGFAMGFVTVWIYHFVSNDWMGMAIALVSPFVGGGTLIAWQVSDFGGSAKKCLAFFKAFAGFVGPMAAGAYVALRNWYPYSPDTIAWNMAFAFGAGLAVALILLVAGKRDWLSLTNDA